MRFVDASGFPGSAMRCCQHPRKARDGTSIRRDAWRLLLQPCPAHGRGPGTLKVAGEGTAGSEFLLVDRHWHVAAEVAPTRVHHPRHGPGGGDDQAGAAGGGLIGPGARPSRRVILTSTTAIDDVAPRRAAPITPYDCLIGLMSLSRNRAVECSKRRMGRRVATVCARPSSVRHPRQYTGAVKRGHHRIATVAVEAPKDRVVIGVEVVELGEREQDRQVQGCRLAQVDVLLDRAPVLAHGHVLADAQESRPTGPGPRVDLARVDRYGPNAPGSAGHAA